MKKLESLNVYLFRNIGYKWGFQCLKMGLPIYISLKSPHIFESVDEGLNYKKLTFKRKRYLNIVILFLSLEFEFNINVKK